MIGSFRAHRPTQKLNRHRKNEEANHKVVQMMTITPVPLLDCCTPCISEGGAAGAAISKRLSPHNRLIISQPCQ